MNCKVIHKNLDAALDQVRKDTHHASLESARGITQAKWHLSASKDPKLTSEGGLVLIFLSYKNLEIPGVSIEEAEIGFPS